MSARAREREVAKQKAERCAHTNVALYYARDRFLSRPPMIATGNMRCVKKSWLQPALLLPHAIESVCSFEMRNSSKSGLVQLLQRERRRTSCGGALLCCMRWLAALLQRSRLTPGAFCRFCVVLTCGGKNWSRYVCSIFDAWPQMTAAVTAHAETDRDRGALFPVHGSNNPPFSSPQSRCPPHACPPSYNMGALLADTRFKLSLALTDAGLYGTEAGRRAMCTVQVRAGSSSLLCALRCLLTRRCFCCIISGFAAAAARHVHYEREQRVDRHGFWVTNGATAPSKEHRLAAT